MAETWTKEFPSVDGWYWYRWNDQTTIFSIALGKVWGALSAGEQHPPREGAEWLGPISPSDFQQAKAATGTAVREAVAETWKAAIVAVPEVGVTFSDGYEQWEGSPDFRERVLTALESAAPKGEKS